MVMKEEQEAEEERGVGWTLTSQEGFWQAQEKSRYAKLCLRAEQVKKKIYAFN